MKDRKRLVFLKYNSQNEFSDIFGKYKRLNFDESASNSNKFIHTRPYFQFNGSWCFPGNRDSWFNETTGEVITVEELGDSPDFHLKTFLNDLKTDYILFYSEDPKFRGVFKKEDIMFINSRRFRIKFTSSESYLHISSSTSSNGEYIQFSESAHIGKIPIFNGDEFCEFVEITKEEFDYYCGLFIKDFARKPLSL